MREIGWRAYSELTQAGNNTHAFEVRFTIVASLFQDLHGVYTVKVTQNAILFRRIRGRMRHGDGRRAPNSTDLYSLKIQRGRAECISDSAFMNGNLTFFSCVALTVLSSHLRRDKRIKPMRPAGWRKPKSSLFKFPDSKEGWETRE
jgi:hypothetical protein